MYTAEQATRGKDVYAMHCVSCHTPASHTGPVFAAKWEGRPLWEFFGYRQRIDAQERHRGR